MPVAACSDEEFITLFPQMGTAKLAKRLDIGARKVLERRRRIELRYGIVLRPPGQPVDVVDRAPISHYSQRIELSVTDGYVLVGSDSHFWPGIVTTAHRAFVHFCKKLQPVAIIKNGDELDGATISRHAPIGWEKRPSLIEEIEATKDRLGEVVRAAPKARHLWPLGNHDARFNTRLATLVPEYAKVHGTSLKDHFPDFEPCWSVFINDEVVVKHRYRNGIHATHQNVVNSGKTIVTGHLHSLRVTPFTDYGGTRWGVDCGSLAEPFGPQFEYLEDSPRNWRSGFAVLPFVGGMLLQPQLCRVIDEDHVDYCGHLIEV